MRQADLTDLDYFEDAAHGFLRNVPFRLDPPHYRQMMASVIMSDQYLALVGGEPVSSHCVAQISAGLYSPDIFVKVLSTWGPGGLELFRAVDDWARDMGARYLVADSFIEPRIEKFYRRRGMGPTDHAFLKEY